jgi:hypothetical protein
MNIVIVSAPYVDTVEPIMAPALLKGVLKSYGIDSTALDLNIEIVNKLSNHPRKQKLLDFFFSQTIHVDCIDDIYDLILFCQTQILKYNPSVVSLSLLIYSCQIFTKWLCASLKQTRPDLKIIIGGTGIKNFVGEDNLDFCIQLKNLKLIDDFIVGDGEVSFYKLIQGDREYPGINSNNWVPIPDLDAAPWPDYSDYDFSLYEKVVIPLFDSRGCIKNCEFCDVIEYWQKFQYRTAENIFSEMLYQINKHSITKFSFRSSLVNGNLKEFKKLLTLISNYNQGKNKDKQISWEGYFIIRGAKYHTEDLWQKLQTSNGTLLVGVESVIQSVRNRLGKTFDDADIDHDLAMGQKYKVPLVLLMIVAYPTETKNDFEYTKQWFRDRKEYANNSVVFVHLSFASILPGTQLARRSSEYGIKKGKLPSIWINQNLNISSAERKQYLLDLYKICTNDCGFAAHSNEQTLEHTYDQY